ncbi:hypothetical protein ACNKHR_04980 [Shigella flexneri]
MNKLVADITKEDCGTEITLHLREGQDQFLDDSRVRSIISKYSDAYRAAGRD